jgi:type I restriction enzyme, S subunit
MNSFPKEWTIDRLKDVSAINASSLPANTDADYKFAYLEISNVNYHGIIDPKAIERLRYEEAPSRARRRLAKNCTAISSVRPNLQAAAFIEDAGDDFVCSTGFNVVQPAAHKLSPKFAYYSLLADGARQYFEARAKGVGYPAVDDKDFQSFVITLPPVLEQQRIAAYLDASCAAIDAAVAAKRDQLETLDGLRKSIIQRAVTRGISEGVVLESTGNPWLEKLPRGWKLVCAAAVRDPQSSSAAPSPAPRLNSASREPPAEGQPLR